MAVAMMVDNPEGSQELYEQIRAHIGLEKPAGGIFHIAGPSPNGGWRVIEVWESEEEAQRFFQERFIPALRALGIDGAAAAARVLARPQRDAVGEAEMEAEHYETIVIGGSQAGLTAGYYLAREGREFLILEANDSVGDAWRNRWDSMRLFTPAKFSRLPGMRIPGASEWSFVTKDEMADYLEEYARRFKLPVQDGRHRRRADEGRRMVRRLGGRSPVRGRERDRGDRRASNPEAPRLRVRARSADRADALVGVPRSVAARGRRRSGRRCGQLRRRDRLRARRVASLACSPGRAPVRSRCPTEAFVSARASACSGSSCTTSCGSTRGSAGSSAPELLAHAAPLIRRREQDLAAVGIERVERVAGVQDGLPVLEDGRVVDVPNVIWCTGFRNDFSWIDLPVFDEDGQPRHYRGVVESEPGLYFLGLVFQYSASSDVLPGRGRDARYIAEHIAVAAARGGSGRA